jgi:hypothetical protein
MRPYLKSVAAVVGAAIVAVHQLTADGSPWTLVRTLMVALVVFGAISVYIVPSLTAGVGAYAKEFVALGTAGVEAAIPLLDDGVVTGSEWLLITIAVMTAVGIPMVGNRSVPRAISA